MSHLEAAITNRARKGGVPRSMVDQYVQAAYDYYKTTTKSKMTTKKKKNLRDRLRKKIRGIVKRAGGTVSGIGVDSPAFFFRRLAEREMLRHVNAANPTTTNLSGVDIKKKLQTGVAPKVKAEPTTFSKLADIGI